MTLPRLTKITFEKCPECGCRDIAGLRLGNGVGKHSCGEWREFINFRCGSEYEYTPNFGEIVCNKPCLKEGINEYICEVTVQVRLRVRKDTDLSELQPQDLFKVPGTDNTGTYQWKKHDLPDWQRKAEVVRVHLVRTTKLKKAK